jgi:uncharacterized LabA/DUF88 family protein
MARLAIFVDGGYVAKLGEREFSIWTDLGKLSEEIRQAVAAKTPEAVDLLRTYYYDCLPYQSDPPTADEAQRMSQRRAFFSALQRMSRFTVREGRLMFRGLDARGEPIFQQKRVDLLLGLDFALLSGKRQVTHAAVVSGDSDLVPALEVARQEGISVWMIHGPKASKIDGKSTYAQELWDAADERLLLTQALMNRCARPPRKP